MPEIEPSPQRDKQSEDKEAGALEGINVAPSLIS